MLMPILTFGSGRSGSTVLMQLLGSDPQCVFGRSHSFEERYLSHFMQFAYQFDGIDLTGLGRLDSVISCMGLFPKLQQQHDDKLAASLTADKVFARVWQTFSHAVREDSPLAKFYAEKIPASVILWNVPIAHHTVFHVRDPRDVFLSANAFMRKRNVVGFGRQYCDNDIEFAISIASGIAEEAANFRNLQLKKLGTCIRVRYEDLVVDPEGALQELTARTGLNLVTDMDAQLYEHHKTTSSLQESIYRWKHDRLSREVEYCFSSLLTEELSVLGYDPGNENAALELSAIKKDGQLITYAEISGAQCGHSADLNGLVIMLDEQLARIRWEVALNAENIEEIWICASIVGCRYISFSWSGDHGSGSSNDHINDGNHIRVIRIGTKAEPQWSGKIDEISLSFMSERATGVVNLQWIRFVPKMSFWAKSVAVAESVPADHSVVTSSDMRLLKGELNSYRHQVQTAGALAIQHEATIGKLNRELQTTIEVVNRLNSHIAHLERDRNLYKSRWDRLMKIAPVRNLIELRGFFKKRRPPDL